MPGDDARDRALDALRRAIYLLDRGLAPSQKVRAFARAADVVNGLDPQELEALVSTARLTELPGIGASTASVVTDAVNAEPSRYLADLDERTA